MTKQPVVTILVLLLISLSLAVLDTPLQMAQATTGGGNHRVYLPIIAKEGLSVAPLATPVTIPSPTLIVPTAIPSPTSAMPTGIPKSATPTATSSPASVTPTATPSSTPANPACLDLSGAETATQVQLVEQNLDCVVTFVNLLVESPSSHLDAFYILVASTQATDPLWSVVFDELRLGHFRFIAPVVENLRTNLPGAIAACHNSYRCPDWNTWILPSLYIGGMYRCPSDLTILDQAALLDSLPYGDYACTESTSSALAPLADTTTIISVMHLIETQGQGWSRRNGIRTLGRFAERPAGDSAHLLVTGARAADVQAVMMDRLQNDRDANVLHDAIWVLDSFYYPFLPMQPYLENITADSGADSDLRFRAILALARLIYSKTGILPTHDLDFILSSLQSDEMWVRAEAAFICETLRDTQLDGSSRTQIINALYVAWANEQELTAKAYLSRALDHYNGNTLLFDALQYDYEAAHLGSTVNGNGIVIRSGLPTADLPPLVALMENERTAFFGLMGPSFGAAVPNDPNPSMQLVLFATQNEYQEYMNTFVGYGAYAGGLYLENSGTLYTYQRTPQQSSYTVEQLIQHEFGHYLQGRYIYPGLWTDAGYNTEPKGWADEGMAQFLGGLIFRADGTYTTPLWRSQLAAICDTHPYRDLSALVAQREGYDQAGTFDYPNAWAFVYYLMTQRQPVALNVYGAMRSSTYHLNNLAAIAGVSSVAELETAWHTAIGAWCAERPILTSSATLAKMPTSRTVISQQDASLPPQEAYRPGAKTPSSEVIRLIK